MNYYAAAKCPGSGCPWANETESSTHFDYIAKVVDTLGPDIMNLCEVEGVDELNLLRSRMINGANYVANLIPGTDTATGQNVGLLTKSNWTPFAPLSRTEERVAYPLAGSKCGYTGANGTVGVSKHYLTEFVFYDRPTLLVGAHLLAYPEDPTRCAEREAQAQVLQNTIVEYLKNRDTEVIVLGDFNDFDGSVVDANGNLPTSRVLDILKGAKGDKAGKYLLKSSAEWILKEERYTDWWDENGNCVSGTDEFSMIDHVLLTPGLFEKIKSVGVYHGYEEFCGKYNSDHFPVVVDFV
jgi:endonuclease/exonuclease/phosphatase family metal-dependent hydrolase